MIRYDRKPVSDLTLITLTAFGMACASFLPASAAERTRQIEEVVVTAEKVEATVSDTSISITAFNSEMIEDFGMQGADEMINYLPATTRDQYDIRIRGVGRNFRALGGDPGVATYYNGVFSPDFGIAASENSLYDLERIEVLRGPQGTLYGRNAIGGALNYVTKRPTYDWTGELRTQVGSFNAREFYGYISGPLIQDTLALRLVGMKQDRDGSQDNLNGEDINSTDDSNVTMSLNWRISDNMELTIRGNDRESDRIFGSSVFITEGSAPERGTLSSDHFAHGLRPVAAGTPNALVFTNPLTGAQVSALHRRPGIDPAASHQPNAMYNQMQLAPLIAGSSASNPNDIVSVNQEGGDCASWPSIANSCNDEFFGHRASQTDFTWDISETMSLKYIFGHTDFVYTFNQDIDESPADFSKRRQTVNEDVQNKSHELQLNWGLGDNFTATSGVYFFDEVRRQQYSLSNTTPRYTEAFNYGVLGGFISSFTLPHQWLGDAGDHRATPLGRWGGDPRGDWYVHDNWVNNEATAVYTQGTYRFNDNYQLVVGVRWAEDKKRAAENRSYYFEQAVGGGGFMDFILLPMTVFDPASPCGSFNILECLTGSFAGLPAAGLTPLAAMNVIWGRATLTGDPTDPISPVCALDDASCATPMLLVGMPFSQNQMTSGNDTWSDVNYRVNLDWTPNEDVLMYFSVTTGYRAGGYSLGVTDSREVNGSVLSDPSSYDKEEVIAFEVGYKGMHLNNTVQLNASVYQYQYDNYQDRLDVFDPVRNTGVDIVQNAEGAKNTGFEVDALWLATDALTLGGNYSYTDATYDEDYFVVVDDDPSLPPSLFGGPAVSPDLYIVNAKGAQLKRIPKHKATVFGSYRWETGFGPITARSSVAFTGEYYANGVERDYDLVPDRTRVDASVGWRDTSDSWNVRLFVDNLTDEKMLRGVGSGGESSNWQQEGTILYPRFYGLDVKYTWR